jgi:DnaJ-class molecular chaperone
MRYRLVLFVFLLMSLGCKNPLDSNSSNNSSNNVPADHTTSVHGVNHKPGLNNAATNCTSCHGSDLKGGTAGVSCYQCHGKKWS